MKKAYYADHIFFNNKIEENSYILVKGSKIEGITKDLPNEYEKKAFHNSAIFPSLINTHSHIPMTFLRGFADDLPLNEWLTKYIWPAEKKWISAEYVRDATFLAAVELIKGGTSCVNDMYFHTPAMIEVVEQSGLRAVLGCGLMEPSQKTGNILENISNLANKYKNNDFINISICPHALYTVPPEMYKQVIKYAQKHDILVHTHLSETKWEVDEIKKRYGKTPVKLMDEVGAFDCKSVFAHCVHLTDGEIELLGKKNVNISHCLQSNLKLASGFAPIKQLMEAGANISIGTDGAASNNDLDMLSEMSSVALFHKGLNEDPTAFNSETTLECATKNAAKALYWKNIGELKEGFQADFMVVSFDESHMQPLYNPLSHLIYSAQKNDITDLYVAGKAIMNDRKILTINEKEVIEKAKKWAEKIKS